MSNFEEYLRENRSKLDLPEVNPAVWDQIEGQVQQKRRWLKVVSRIAAAAAIALLLIGVYQWGRHSEQLVIPPAMAAEYELPSTGIDVLIDKQLKRIQNESVPVSYRDDLQLLLQQIRYLDDNYKRQRTALEQGVYEEDNLRDVLRYYRAKVDLLTRIISEIEKINLYEKDNHTEERVTLQL